MRYRGTKLLFFLRMVKEFEKFSNIFRKIPPPKRLAFLRIVRGFKKAINKKGEINMSKKISKTAVMMIYIVCFDTS